MKEIIADNPAPDNEILEENHDEIKKLIEVDNPLWLSVTEAAKIGGIQNKTIRRAIQSKTIKYKIISNRYLIEVSSLVTFLHTRTKLKNKLNQLGIGQYIENWKE